MHPSNSEKVELYIKDALGFISTNAYVEAVEILDKALRIDPRNEVLLECKGLSLSYLGKFEEALGVCDEMLKLDPENVVALGNKGTLLKNTGQYYDAIHIFDRVLEIDPGNVDALSNKKFSLHNLGNFQEASKVCDEMLNVNPRDVSALNYKGFALVELGKYREAVNFFDSVLAIDPENVVALNNKDFSLTEIENESVNSPHFNSGVLEVEQEIEQERAPLQAVQGINKEDDSFWNFLTTRGFWITLGVLYLIWLANDMGRRSNHVLTPNEIQESISECRGWGGVILYDNDGQYRDCAINGRVID